MEATKDKSKKPVVPKEEHKHEVEEEKEKTVTCLTTKVLTPTSSH